MQVEYINPFVKSLHNTFEVMLGVEARRSSMTVKDGSTTSFEISGVIGLSGRAVGAVVLNLSKELAIKAASTMLMEELTDMDDDVCDAVGELTNMVAGAAKAQLAEFDMSVSLPNIVTGQDHEVRFPSNVTPICINFDTDHGPLTLEVGFAVTG